MVAKKNIKQKIDGNVCQSLQRACNIPLRNYFNHCSWYILRT